MALAEDGRRLGKELRRVGKVRGGDQVRVGPGREGSVGRRGRVQPVPELEAGIHEVTIAGQRGHRVDPRLHARVLSAEQLPVSEALVEDPGHDHRGIAPPCAGWRRLDEHVGHDQRWHPIVGLLAREVRQPGAKRPRAIVEKGRRRSEDLEVAGPAQALVPLRAVRGDVQEVAPHAPDDVLVEAVEHRLRGAEPAGSLQVRVTDDRPHVLRRQASRPAIQLRVPEPVVGEAWLPLFELAAAQRIAEPVLHTCQPRRLKRDLSYRCRSPLCGVANGRGIADDLRDDCYRARLCRLTVAAVTNALPRVHREVGASLGCS